MGEECDDGNALSGDKCSATCEIEACGNGVLDPPEECDKGLLNDNGGDCTMLCKRARCGDGYHKTRGTGTIEVCDDGNAINGDGCNPQCTLRGRVRIIAEKPGGMGMADGVGPAARFARLRDMVSDGKHIYLSDSWSCTIRRMEIATGVVSTIAGTPGECGLLNDGKGKKATFTRNAIKLALAGGALFVGEQQWLRKIDLSNSDFWVDTCLDMKQILSDRVTAMYSHPAIGDKFYLADRGAIYSVKLPCICDRIPGKGRCAPELLAGGKLVFMPSDGTGTDARFAYINSMELDTATNRLYVADLCWVRQVDLATKQVKTVAGEVDLSQKIFCKHKDGIGPKANFDSIIGIALTSGTLYLAESSGAYLNNKDQGAVQSLQGWGNIRAADTSTWKVTTVSGIHGTILQGRTPEADGFGPFARFMDPFALALSKDKEILFIAEDASVRTLSLKTGQVATAAGVLVQDFTHFQAHAIAATNGMLYTTSASGDLLEIPLAENRPVRSIKICSKASDMRHNLVRGIVASGSVLYIADVGLIEGICRVDLEGKAGTPCCPTCKETCKVLFNAPQGQSLNWSTYGAAWDGKYFYLTEAQQSRILRLDPVTNKSSSLALGIPITGSMPWGVTSVGDHLYVTLTNDNLVLRIDPDTGGARILGDGRPMTVDGKGAWASFCHPAGIATDGTYLYVGESHCEPDPQTGSFHGHAIRQIDIKTEEVTTLVGPGPRPYVVEGTGNRGSVNWPAALTYDDKTGALYVTDKWDNVVLRVD